MQNLQCDIQDSTDGSDSDSHNEESTTDFHINAATNGENDNLSDNHVPSKHYSNANKSTNVYGGAKPKFGKIISTFGGWGLKENGTKENSQSVKTKASKSKQMVMKKDTVNDFCESQFMNGSVSPSDFYSKMSKSNSYLKNDLNMGKVEGNSVSPELVTSSSDDDSISDDEYEHLPKNNVTDLLDEKCLAKNKLDVEAKRNEYQQFSEKTKCTEKETKVEKNSKCLSEIALDKPIKHENSITDYMFEGNSSVDASSSQTFLSQGFSNSTHSEPTHSVNNEHKLESMINQMSLNNCLENNVSNLDIFSSDDNFSSFIEPPKPHNKPDSADSDNLASVLHQLSSSKPPETPTFSNVFHNSNTAAPSNTVNNSVLRPPVDPQIFQQLLLLTNPFFYNQLQAVEMLYRSQGISISAFQNPQQNFIPTLNETANVNALQASAFLNAPLSDSHLSSSNNPTGFQNSKKLDSCSQPPGIDLSGMTPESSYDPFADKNIDSWLNKYISEENTSFIPPPKLNPNDLLPQNHTAEYESKSSALDTRQNTPSSMVTRQDISTSSAKTDINCYLQENCNSTFYSSKDRRVSETSKSSKSDSLEEVDYIPAPTVKNSSLRESSSRQNRQPISQPRVGNIKRKNAHKR